VSAIDRAIVPRMKTLLLVTIAALASACVAQKPARIARPTVSSVTPECKEIPTLTGKPMRCQALPVPSAQ
jgi:hypothetical protein